jgi:hypothetical protein
VACALTVLALIASIGYPKCAYVPYEVSGSVLDSRDGHPLAGAKILCFLNGQGESRGTDHYGPAELITDKEGRFKGTYHFNAYSGQGDDKQPDRCDRRLVSVTVVVSLIGFHSVEQAAASKQISKSTSDGGKVRVPAVRLVPEGA